MCAEWEDDCAAFVDHIGKRPSPRHSVERIDNSRGYEPGNVKWAVQLDQNNNKENNLLIDCGGGHKMTARRIMQATGADVPLDLFVRRIERGWSIDRSLSTPTVSRPYAPPRRTIGKALERLSRDDSLAETAQESSPAEARATP